MLSAYYRSTGSTQTRKRERERANIETIKCLLFFSIWLCLCVSSLFHHILRTASSHFNPNKGSNHGKNHSWLLPTPSTSYPQLSFLPGSPPSALLASCMGDCSSEEWAAADPPLNKCKSIDHCWFANFHSVFCLFLHRMFTFPWAKPLHHSSNQLRVTCCYCTFLQTED